MLAKRWAVVIAIILILLGVYLMPDAPDWYKYRKESQRHILADMAELAVRLGSPVTYRRGGTVIYIDDFSWGSSGWLAISTTANQGFGIVAASTWRGGYSLVLTPGDADPWDCVLYKRFPYLPTNKMGYEITFWGSTNLEQIGFDIYRRDDDIYERAGLAVNVETGVIVVLDEGEVPRTVLTLSDLTDANPTFHNLKFVVDWENNIYDVLYFDNHKVDISDYGLYQGTGSGERYIDLRIGAIDEDGSQGYAVVDDFIMTVDEP